MFEDIYMFFVKSKGCDYERFHTDHVRERSDEEVLKVLISQLRIEAIPICMSEIVSQGRELVSSNKDFLMIFLASEIHSVFKVHGMHQDVALQVCGSWYSTASPRYALCLQRVLMMLNQRNRLWNCSSTIFQIYRVRIMAAHDVKLLGGTWAGQRTSPSLIYQSFLHQH